MPTVTLPRDLEAPISSPLPLYNVIAHNCTCHSFDDVIFGLIRVLGMSASEARGKADEIDHYGRGIVAQAHQELAEHYADRCANEIIGFRGTRLRTSVEPAI
jgi:ATP-dependent Clp protease adapter protein ClpS